ncbi:hypothetical protein [Biomaibacter acetigenes]|nr:hypothetical protein [Biomaibacter acetigenes]
MTQPVWFLGTTAFYAVVILSLIGASGVALYLSIVGWIERKELLK